MRPDPDKYKVNVQRGREGGLHEDDLWDTVVAVYPQQIRATPEGIEAANLILWAESI